MRVPVEAVRTMKREFKDANELFRQARFCGLPLTRKEAHAFWKGDMDGVKGLESFFLMIGLKLELRRVQS